jgi:hypothetical protein
MPAKEIGLTLALAAFAISPGPACSAKLYPACGPGRPCVARSANCHTRTIRVCAIERGQKVCKVKTITVCV